jgi:hypothetical protein
MEKIWIWGENWVFFGFPISPTPAEILRASNKETFNENQKQMIRKSRLIN